MGIASTMVRELKLVRRIIYNRFYLAKARQRDTITDFHRLYYDSAEFYQTWAETYWMGHKIWKCPLDLWLYQEILFALKPDLIIETGTAYGGSALYFSSLCDLLGNGKVVTIDVEHYEGRPQHPRLTYITGSSTAPDIVARVKAMATDAKCILVVLDSDHRKEHVLEELDIYTPMVNLGSYVIVEDTNMNGHPVYRDFGPCSYEALEEFLPKHPEFVHDTSMDKFLLTFNPGGYLKRIA